MFKSWSSVPWLFLCVLGAAASASPAMSEPVSPAGRVGSRCPNFSWSVDGSARGYEVVVYRVSPDGELDRAPVVSVKLPAGAAGWTPPLEQCFAGGERYAWTVRAAGGPSEAWSEAALFEVAPGPGPEEVEAALAVLQRYLSERQVDTAGGDDRIAEPLEAVGPRSVTTRGSDGRDGRRPVLQRPRDRAVGDVGAAEESTGVVRTVQAAVPTLGNPSLRLSANVALSAASNVFKDGSVFLWDDATGNTALGRLALASATGTATNNTAVGRQALRYTVPGAYNSANGSYNTAVGDLALRSNTTGTGNTASGYAALRYNTSGSMSTASGYSALRSSSTGYFNTASGAAALRHNTTGFKNTASGANALIFNTTGSRNTAVGYMAGYLATTGHDNVFVGSGAVGVAGEGNTIRIGGATGTDPKEQNRTFIAGIHGITTGATDAIAVLIDSNGQLGTISSSEATKQDIAEIGEASRRLLELRPVSFRYRQHAATDPETPVQYGLIAEEVAEVFPELVVFDEEGRPETVKYHLLAPLLLHELQRAERELGATRDALEEERRSNVVRDRRYDELRERMLAHERHDRRAQRPARSTRGS